jgi:desulfoferrodoxin-like iron-binding protein
MASLGNLFVCKVCGKVSNIIQASSEDTICCDNPMSATAELMGGPAVVRPNLDAKQHIATTIAFFCILAVGLIFFRLQAL